MQPKHKVNSINLLILKYINIKYINIKYDFKYKC